MRTRFIVCFTSLVVAFVASACIELTTTNEGGTAGTGGDSPGVGGTGMGNTGSGSASTGGMGVGGADVSSSSSSSSSGAPSKCEEPNTTCSVCEACEGQTVGGACSSEYEKCRDNMNCALVDDCVHACPSGNFTCINGCWGMLDSMGNGLYSAYYLCMYCGACLQNCSMSIPCD